MLDRPGPDNFLTAVIATLRSVIEHLPARKQFEVRVAINALGLVQRELSLGIASETRERARLQALLGMDGDLEMLNEALCVQLREKGADGMNAQVAAHLWETTLEKIRVDQPNYPTLRTLSDDKD
ncbi:DUF6285 domain-containing protein [Sphingobium sp. EM0848]|uniref:DUF6285 domain-containing protein n=1 Tax=Sphingobium sp. EM0848 TaxID=2743473 RepID=UPI00159BF411|nr:DUF6285 domain-containing protein [Sphingobium sp. EM0848]